MKRFQTICAALAVVLLAASAGLATDYQYGWSISSSSVDPFVNTGPFVSGLNTLYLWYQCSVKDGMSAAEFGLASSSPANLIVGLNVQNTFLNAGTATQPLFAVGLCPTGPVVAAELVIVANAPGEYCIVNSNRTPSRNVTVDCRSAPEVHTNATIGFSTTGSAPTCNDMNPLLCNPVPVDATSWGQVKGLYR
jgi:hypothetical protein